MSGRLGDIVDVRLGYQPSGKVESDPNGPFRIIQIKDFDENRQLIEAGITRFNPGEKNLSDFTINERDVLFLARGHKNWAALAAPNLDKTVAVSYFLILRPKVSQLDPAYLAWYLNQPPAQKYLSRLARRGTHIPIVPKSALVDLMIEVPPLPMQYAIANSDREMRKEQELMTQIANKKQELIRAVSLKAIGGAVGKNES